MKDDTKEYALVLTPNYRRYVKAIEHSIGKLNINVYLVSEKEVEKLM